MADEDIPDFHYVDPYSEQLSENPATKYELKELWTAGRITAESYVWNQYYEDYVQISDVPELLEFLQSGEGMNAQEANDFGGKKQVGQESPENWVEYTTEEGRAYFHNIVTNEITWEKPDCLKTEDELGRAGDWRWIPDKHDGYVQAKLIATKKNGSMVFATETNEEHTISKNSETYKVLWAILSRSTADLVMLDSLDPPIILHNLKKRFANNEIYTKIGNILISVNPYKLLPLYTPSVLEEYVSGDNKHLAPHVYEIAKNAFAAMLDTNVSQSIIISGESGAGKTECTKQCLQFIAESTGSENNVEQKLLSTNPILETFGNAKTVRNNNSSRFGKYIEIYFDITGAIVAATNTNYLLEKVRVIQCDDSERNYHAFYQLIKAAPDDMRKEYALTECKDYNYTQGLIDAPGIDDHEEFRQLLESMSNIGLSEKETKSIFQLTAALLWIGNIDFDSQEAATGITQKSCTVKESSNHSLNMVCKLLCLDVASVKEALTHKVFSIGNKSGRTLIGLSDEEALVNRDSLSKFLYDRMFDWIVQRLNNALIDPKYKDLKKYRHIGILDIFGFEIFKHNSFEQLCINFTNEKLQQHFDMNTFKLEEEMYRSEGIKFDHVNYVDNQPVLDLIEKKKTGIMSVLDAQMKMPKADDSTFLIAINKMQDKNKDYYHPYVKKQGHFVINHYAGEVVYDSEGFMDKNRDSLNANLITLMGQSKFEFIQILFPDAFDSNKARKISLGAQFRKQLDALMATLNETEPHYIRCIKPNAQKVPDVFQGHMVLEQLVYSGVFEAVKIRKSGYPFRRSHKEFFNRYRCIDRKRNWNSKPKTAVQEVIKHLTEKEDCDLTDVQVGNTMVLYRANEHNTLELRRNFALDEVVRFIQNNIRRWQDIGLFVEMKRVKPILEKAIKTRTIAALDAAIAETVTIDYDMKLIRDAKELKQRIVKEIELTNELKELLKADDPEQIVDELHRKLAECEKYELNNEATNAAKQIVAKYEARVEARKVIKECIEIYDEDLMREAIELAILAEIPADDEDVLKVKNALKRIEEERKLIEEFESDLPKGAWLQENDVVATNALEALLAKAEKFDLRTAKGKFLIDLAKRLIKLRKAIKTAVETENDDAWNNLRSVIDEIVDEEETMKDHTEIVVINKYIYEHFNNNAVTKLEDTLGKAVSDMAHNVIELQLKEAKGLNITSKELPLITKANDLLINIKEVLRLLNGGMKTNNIRAVKSGLLRAHKLNYNKPIVTKAKDWYRKFNHFQARVELATKEINVSLMKELVDEAQSLKFRSEEIDKMKEYIYKMPEERLLALQLNAAVSSRDPNKVCAITMRLKELFFDKCGTKFEWSKYGKLLTPAAWAKASSWPFGREKLEKSFYSFTIDPIHHPLTDLRAATQVNIVGKGTAVSKLSFLKKESMQMFKNILGYMGDRNYAQPLILVRDILKKCMTYAPLRAECFAQLIKQLTENPKRSSEERGWNLLGVMLDTFAPPKDIENYLEVWLRTHPAPHKDEKDFYVKLLHQTVFQGSRTKVPSVNEIDDLLRGTIRTFEAALQSQYNSPMVDASATPGMAPATGSSFPALLDEKQFEFDPNEVETYTESKEDTFNINSSGINQDTRFNTNGSIAAAVQLPPSAAIGSPFANKNIPGPPQAMGGGDGGSGGGSGIGGMHNDGEEHKDGIQLPSVPLKDTTGHRAAGAKKRKKKNRKKHRDIKKFDAPELTKAQMENISQQRTKMNKRQSVLSGGVMSQGRSRVSVFNQSGTPMSIIVAPVIGGGDGAAAGAGGAALGQGMMMMGGGGGGNGNMMPGRPQLMNNYSGDWIPPPPPPPPEDDFKQQGYNMNNNIHLMNNHAMPAIIESQNSLEPQIVKQQSYYMPEENIDMTGWTDQQKEWHRQWQEYNRQQQQQQQQQQHQQMMMAAQRASNNNVFGGGMFQQVDIPPPPADGAPGASGAPEIPGPPSANSNNNNNNNDFGSEGKGNEEEAPKRPLPRLSNKASGRKLPPPRPPSHEGTPKAPPRSPPPVPPGVLKQISIQNSKTDPVSG